MDISYNSFLPHLATYSMNRFALSGRSLMGTISDVVMQRRRILQAAVRLITEEGFEPVAVGSHERAKEFDAGASIFGRALTAAEERRELGIKS